MKILFLMLALCFSLAHSRRVNVAAGRTVRAGGLVGGYSSQNLTLLTEEDKIPIQEAANKAIELMNQVKTSNGNNNALPLSLVDIIEVKTQIVAGINYAFKLNIIIDGQPKICILKVSHLYPWLNGGQWYVYLDNPENTVDPCASYIPNARKRRSAPLLGGVHEAATDDKAIQEAALWAMEHLNKMSNSMFLKAMRNIISATKQVINGYRYRLSISVVPTSCHNSEVNSKKTLKECPASNDAKSEACDVTVTSTAGKYAMESVSCKAEPVLLGQKLGGDDHDYKPHGMIGGGDHDYKPHGMIGGGDHDYKPHGMIGGGDHDYKPHGMVGGGDHDYKPHGMVGGGDHDYKPHGMIGGDDHDYKIHTGDAENAILGKDTHDYLPHKDQNMASVNLRDAILNFGSGQPNNAGDSVQQMSIPVDNSECVQYKTAFEDFKAKYHHLYSSQKEEDHRFQVFCANMEKVKVIQKAEQGSGQYGATKFADISEEEFRKFYLGFKPIQSARKWPAAKIPTDPIPDAWDWRDHGAVTPVKNQGMCGSCWAFSTTGNIEGQWAINSASRKLLSLSEQELVDCDKEDEGCNGGLPSQAYDAIMKLGGIETENDYTYEGKDDKCKFNQSEVVVKLTGAVNISQDENEMAAWLYKNGPISIGINAFAMQFYMGGISHPWKLFCSHTSLDHGVLIVGYGKKGNEPYWIVKNSWGEHWGVKGYYLVYRGDGTCGLNTMCTSATVN
ncbi:unnamed protein product [Lymnaea stagnalis]|uniref:Uncharacterized protein n=1 Tax=Lymnaea stagnalis TaxID=6523 RepID=A0AAV2HZ24_LYMST